MKFVLELLCLCLLFGNTFCDEEGCAPGSTYGDRVLHRYMGMIPDNTGPDGIVTKALAALGGLSGELAQNSGVNNPFGDRSEGSPGSHLPLAQFSSLPLLALVSFARPLRDL